MTDYDKLSSTLAAALMDLLVRRSRRYLTNNEIIDLADAVKQQDWAKVGKYVEKYKMK